MGFWAGLGLTCIGFGLYWRTRNWIKNGFKFVYLSHLFFGIFSCWARVLSYIFGLARFGLGLYRIQVLSDQAKKTQIKNKLKFIYPNLLFFRLFQLNLFCQLCLRILARRVWLQCCNFMHYAENWNHVIVYPHHTCHSLCYVGIFIVSFS